MLRKRRVLGALLLCLLLLSGVAVRGEEAVSTAAQTESTAAPAYAPPTVIQSNGTPGWPQLGDTNCDYFCVMDADTGAILAEKGMSVETPPASLTKIMTCLLAVESGKLDDQVTMTETGVEYAISGSSNLYTQVGEVFTLRDMLYGVMLKSANDIATQVGEYLGDGSLDSFLAMMNERAQELGCTGTYFANACGMPNEAHHSTARDLALISREALQNDLFREIVHTKEYTIPSTNLTASRTFQNHHKFLVTEEYAYDGIIGGKTGYTDLAGSCLATYVERDGRTVIVIALHCLGMDNCLQDTRMLCDYGLGEFENVALPEIEGERIAGGVVTLPKGTNVEELTASVSEETTETGAIRTTAVYTWNGRTVGSLVTELPPVTSAPASEPESVPEETAESVSEETTESDAGTVPESDAVSVSGQASGAQASAETKEMYFELPVIGGVDLVKLVMLAGTVLILLILLLLFINIHMTRARKRAKMRRQREEDDRQTKGE